MSLSCYHQIWFFITKKTVEKILRKNSMDKKKTNFVTVVLKDLKKRHAFIRTKNEACLM